MPDGADFEKIRYTPGIYDSVELMLSGLPRVANVQVVPDIESQVARVVAEIADPASSSGRITCEVREAKSQTLAGQVEATYTSVNGGATVELHVPIANCRLWSPEDPFLYEVTVATTADALSTRFGMRTFHFDVQTGRAILNGRPYPMRGTNVCVYRFFEDPVRGDRPWREEWVRRLHRTFRSMHWNSIRYCIGFPPEIWYRIADEEGFLIQDEFPIWYGGQWPKELTTEKLIPEYREWMRERWNHPSVVIWDAQNESVTDQIGPAIRSLRQLDLSNRPWDNGWSAADAVGDVYEAHPYAYSNPSFRMSAFATLSGRPGTPGALTGNPAANALGNPVIINEYGWLWLNRDGTPTTLTRKAYEVLLGRRIDGGAATYHLCAVAGGENRVLARPARGGRRAALLRPRLFAARRPDQRSFSRHRAADVGTEFRQVRPRCLLTDRSDAGLLGRRFPVRRRTGCTHRGHQRHERSVDRHGPATVDGW